MKWKDVVGYEGIYQVSDVGDVKSLDRLMSYGRHGTVKYKGILLRGAIDSFGYRQYNLCNGVTKSFRSHVLVARAFIGHPPEGLQVLHGVNGITDNSVTNLSYGTPSENNLDKHRDGTMQCTPVKRSDGKVFRSLTEACKKTGADNSQISKVCRGILKTAKGFTWTFITKQEYQNESY